MVDHVLEVVLGNEVVGQFIVRFKDLNGGDIGTGGDVHYRQIECGA